MTRRQADRGEVARLEAKEEPDDVATRSAGEHPRVNQLMRFPGAVRREPAIDAWIDDRPDDLAVIARHWFDVLRACGDDVRELLHDGHPTACVGDAAFGYVNVFTAHVNVGFFRGADLHDPAGLLEGTGRFMRHVKLRPGTDANGTALTDLVHAAYADMEARLRSAQNVRSTDSKRSAEGGRAHSAR
jgi:hypothetical protein